RWYENADQIADAFATIGYDREEVRRMFYKHLDITKQETAMRIAGNYPADIAAFNAAEQEMLSMADMFTAGILRQFPGKV
ncbi:MAG: acetylglutamate kinase, partial [Oscillospiraceae bacterium]|nr:acetylglutamate kinase [Oscillospiraceae bacterium]